MHLKTESYTQMHLRLASTNICFDIVCVLFIVVHLRMYYLERGGAEVKFPFCHCLEWLLANHHEQMMATSK